MQEVALLILVGWAGKTTLNSLPHVLRYASSLPGLLSGVALGVGRCELACGPGGLFWGGVAVPGVLVGTCFGTGFGLG